MTNDLRAAAEAAMKDCWVIRKSGAFYRANKSGYTGAIWAAGVYTRVAGRQAAQGLKTEAHLNKRDGHSHTRHLPNPREHGRKGVGAGAEWFDQNLCRHSSGSASRKAASALIAKIPEPLARHIAVTFKPKV